MPRGHRIDHPNAWHHVMNRGIARRPVFETPRDVRYFLSRLARVVREGLLEVHAFVVLTTHFHLLVRSPRGELSAAMQRVQNEYSRWFNRSRKRDGTLFRGRYRSRRVETLTYRRLLVRYIDANPVQAGCAPAAALFPHGSARHYARRRGPPWLTRDWIEACVRDATGRPEYEPLAYAQSFGAPIGERLMKLVEARIQASRDGVDPLDDLVGATPSRVMDWMRGKALLADGVGVNLPVCDEEGVDAVILAESSRCGEWQIRWSRKTVSVWPVVHVALLRELCGATLRDAGVRSGLSLHAAHAAHERHRAWLTKDPDYASRVADIARRVLSTCHGES